MKSQLLPTQVEAEPAQPSYTAVRSGLLQRKCACGGTPTLGGECEECAKKKRLGLPSYFRKPAGPSRLADSFAEPTRQDSATTTSAYVGHNFSQLGIHSHGTELDTGSYEQEPERGDTRGTSSNPQTILEQLGSGQPFDGASRSRMESVFQQDFSHVRIHTDGTAAQLSHRLSAQAFAIGNHVAFASGQYQPGTVIGDALLAHELAHVSQQKSANASALAMQAGGAECDALESDADVSATHAVVSLWGRAKGLAAGVAHNAMPRLQSGLRLSRCPPKCEPKKYQKENLNCDQICDLAYKDPCLNNGSGGGVICYFGTKCPCVFDLPPEFNVKKGECPKLDENILIHEKRHLDDPTCDPDTVHEGKFGSISKQMESECAHRKESADLLDEAIKKEPEPCKSKMIKLRNAQADWVKNNCGG